MWDIGVSSSWERPFHAHSAGGVGNLAESSQ